MSTNFPTSLDSLTNPSSGNPLNSPSHSAQHANANDAIEALEAKVGVDGSAVTTSHDYKLSGVTGSDKAVSKTGTETLTNKTLTSPKINVGSDATGDMYYRESDTTLSRLGIGSPGNVLSVSVAGKPEWIANPSASDASTSVKGVVEMATQSEVDARTTSGGTGALLAVNPQQLRATQYHDYAADSVGTDAYAISVTPAPTAYASGDEYTFKAGTANTGQCTLNVNTLGAKTIKKGYNSDLETGDILANQIVKVVYDGTNFQLQSPPTKFIRFANGNTSRDVSTTGSQTIAHGLGKTPLKVRITAVKNASSVGLMSWGVYDGTTQSCVYSGLSDSLGPENNESPGYVVALADGTGSVDKTALATISAIDATNITLTWSKNGSPTGTAYLVWEAEA